MISWRTCVDAIGYLVVRTVVCVVQSLSLETCQTGARWLGWVAYDVVRLRRGVIDDNLAAALPESSAEARGRLARQMWEHLLLMVCEIAQAPRKLHEYSFRRHIHFKNKPLLVRYLLQPRSVVLVTGHFGNFELAGYCAAMFGFPTYTIARRLDNPFLHRFVARFRELRGQFLLDKSGCAPRVADILDQGGTLGLLGDQYAGKKGIWVDFLGRPASCHKAVALFTLTSRAPQLVCYLRRRGGPLQFDLDVVGVADPQQNQPHVQGVRPLTEWYNRRLGDAILETPEQYWWVHRRWKGTPPSTRRAVRRSA